MDYHFSQRDVEKAIRGALKAGLRVGRAEIDPRTGRIILVSEQIAGGEDDPLDDEMAVWRTQHGVC
jgi:hypothetical protein